MLGRAVPFRNVNGEIIKWFGTCTDIHELVEVRQAAKSTREQLLRVIEHARVTLWTINRDRNLTLLEGNLKWHGADINEDCIGNNIYEVFGTHEGNKDIPQLKSAIEDILEERARDEIIEMHIDGSGRWFRTRIMPLLVKSRNAGIEGESYLDGVLGVSMDVTGESRRFGLTTGSRSNHVLVELHKREQELQEQEKENAKLLANASAAKEASQMKSQFLANVSDLQERA